MGDMLYFAEMNFRERKFEVKDKEQQKYFENDSYILSFYGDIWIGETQNKPDLILQEYLAHSQEIVNRLEGLYYLFVYEKRTNQLLVFQDYYTSSEIMYHTQCEGRVFFSNILQTLGQKTNASFQLNDNVLKEFARYGFVPGEETLIKHVYKMKPFHMLLFSEEGFKEKQLDYYFETKTKKEAKERWNEYLTRAISKNCPRNDISMPMSAGFDTNYLLYYFNEIRKTTVNLYTVGGKTGVDESMSVHEIAKHYGRNPLTVCYTAPNCLSSFPEIVWRLGGAVYRRGLFLQYELASMLSKDGHKSLVCGEGADQIMKRPFLEHAANRNFKGKENTYDFLAYIILKKSAIMLNSFDIKGYYPYLNQGFVGISLSLTEENKEDKLFHRGNCKKVMDRAVWRKIHKTGGSTYLHSLFATKEEMDYYLNKIENCPMYHQVFDCFEDKKAQATGTKYLKYVKNFPLYFEKVIARVCSHSMSSFSKKFMQEEKRLQRMMVIIYILLVEELFCSDNTTHYLERGVDELVLKNFIDTL